MNPAGDLLVGLVFIPLLTALAAVLLPIPYRRWAVLLGGLAWPCLLVPLSMAVARDQQIALVFGGWAPPLGIGWRLDALALVVLWVHALAGVAALAGAWQRFEPGTSGCGPFWPLWMILAAGVNAALLAADLFNLYVALELTTLAAVALAVALAALGVIGLIVSHGVVPWISLTLACSFGVYALVRKKAGADPLVGFFCETVLLAPIAAGYLIWLGATGRGAFLAGTAGFDLLLLAAGLITAVPLILYMHGAQRLRLSTIGLMQYTAPTIQLALGVLVYGEAFTPAHAFAFACIWVALAIYSTDAWRSRRAARPEGAAAEA